MKEERRVEVSPLAPAKENYFLNMMQVADNTCRKMNEVKRIDADRIVGVQIADRVVTFSKNSLPLSGKFGMKITGENTYQFIPAVSVRSDDGLLSFEGTAGNDEFYR